MRTSWKIGRVMGIDLYLHPTFLMLLVFIGAMQGGLESVLLASATFGCVLLHELGHALMARRFGIETEDITLYPIGGIARLKRMPRAPGAELLIAMAGPMVNVLIVGILVAALGVLDGSGLDLFLGSLMQINIILAAFNLIPAFPMDGGRVLRALLSGWLGRARATMVAAGLGRGLAVLFGLYCLFNAMWIQAFLAAFIYFAAGAELARVLAEERRRDGILYGEGIWTAPPGYHWVNRGNGVWQLAPIPIHVTRRDGSPWA
ncbi:MAG: site-2 protease family protein [Singulisphaera sp.]|nr:site-2 protease family protein [Singulisphaera sp.]